MKGSWAREVVTRNSSSAQQTDVVRMEAVEACFVLNSPRGTIPIQKFRFGEAKLYAPNHAKANCPSVDKLVVFGRPPATDGVIVFERKT